MLKTLLHVGCGHTTIAHLSEYFRSGAWDEVRFDIDPGVHPDIIGSIDDMSIIASGSVDALFSSHNIEHVWSFEIQSVLSEFRRVLKPTGFAYISCPDITSVAEAIVAGHLEDPLYHSPAGPISAIDILFGHQRAIREGRVYMAHKHAFSAESLAAGLLAAGFAGTTVRRDGNYGLSSLATGEALPSTELEELRRFLLTDGASDGKDYHHGTHSLLLRS